MTGYNTRGSCVELRKDITELIEIGGMPIIASSNGFSWCEDKEMIKEYIKNLISRKNGIERRIQALNKIINEQIW